jgi:uncharacterized protein YcgI (DUF1989 family)
MVASDALAQEVSGCAGVDSGGDAVCDVRARATSPEERVVLRNTWAGEKRIYVAMAR